MMKGNLAKAKILEAYETAKNKTVTEVCRVAEVDRGTFYFHYRKDAEFRLSVVKKQITEKLKAA